MAKFIFSVENRAEKRELIFRGRSFDFSMTPINLNYGIKKGDKPGFERQVSKEFPDLATDNNLLDILDQLNYEDCSTELCDLLDELEAWEVGHERT